MAMLMLDLYPEPHERPVDININTLCNRMHRNNRQCLEFNYTCNRQLAINNLFII